MSDPNTTNELAAELALLASKARINSERWFPATHEERDMKLDVFYALGLAGEAGEVANAVKKVHRDGPTPERIGDVAAELADVFTYLMLLADELDVDLITEFDQKVEFNKARWDRPTERSSPQ
jgi:NTP pyrophosphatase (non-canonical NTP hydrolase)